jgi:hypothetical protein
MEWSNMRIRVETRTALHFVFFSCILFDLLGCTGKQTTNTVVVSIFDGKVSYENMTYTYSGFSYVLKNTSDLNFPKPLNLIVVSEKIDFANLFKFISYTAPIAGINCVTLYTAEGKKLKIRVNDSGSLGGLNDDNALRIYFDVSGIAYKLGEVNLDEKSSEIIDRKSSDMNIVNFKNVDMVLIDKLYVFTNKEVSVGRFIENINNLGLNNIDEIYVYDLQ